MSTRRASDLSRATRPDLCGSTRSSPIQLPPGFRRADGCSEDVTVESCRSMRIALRCHGGQLVVVEVSAGEKPTIRPAPRERLRDLRVGDLVRFVANGTLATVQWVEVE